MASKDFFERRKAQRKGRKVETRETNPNSYLIVTEGTRTEPFYFDGLKRYINGKYGRGIDVVRPSIEVDGEGKGTGKLVEAASRSVARANVKYKQVWLVFDKDDFKDFDDAVKLAENKGFHVAWSNQSFEYWIYLHFNFIEAALNREDWVKKISQMFVKRKINAEGYKKNDENVFETVTTHGSLKQAVINAKRIEQKYQPGVPPSHCDPCTQVHHLICELEPYIQELLK